MSKRFFDISRLKPGEPSKDRAAATGRLSKENDKLYKQAISELSAMSLDEMSEALRSLEGGISSGTEKSTFTLDEIYGTSGFELTSVSDQDVEETTASFADFNTSMTDDVHFQEEEQPFGVGDEGLFQEILDEEPESFPAAIWTIPDHIDVDPLDSVEHKIAEFTQDHLLNENLPPFVPLSEMEDGLVESDSLLDTGVSGVVKDEIVLSLLQLGVVSMSQVFEAIQNRKEGTDLWRELANLPGVDKTQIQASVAEHQGYAFQPYLESGAEESFIDDVLNVLSQEDLARLVAAGLVPLSFEMNPDSRLQSLVVLSSDPLDSKVQGALLSSPIMLECRFCPSEVLAGPLQDTIQWMGKRGIQLTVPSSKNNPLDRSHDAVSAVQAPADVPAKLSAAETSKNKVTSELSQRINKDRVVRSLLAEGMLTEQQAALGLKEFDAVGGKTALWRIIADLKGVNRESVYQAAARVYAFKLEEIDEFKPDHDFVRLTMETLAEEYREEMMELLLVPFEHSIDFETGTGRIIFITPDPTRPDINRLVHELDLGRFELRYASESSIVRLLDTIFPRKNEFMERVSEETDAFDLGMSYDNGEDELDEDALEAEISRSKLINLFEASLVEAVRQGTSDIHIFPNANRQVEIHLRTDGRLKKWHTEDKVHPEAFLAVVKDNSTNVDRFERDAAQDGFIQRNIDGALIRFRVSILPIATSNQEMRAESIVIRILDDRKVLTDITKLGMLDVALERFNKAIRQPHGMIILTGPTGSGKSTTLVAALYQVVTPEVNVLTVEDPVEYIIKGVRQIKLSHKLDLEGALRAILRHDPDIVMVGEMRDRHTAELAIKLANTGHLTFSTLHTNDAPAAVSRLYKMGVEPFLIAYAINLVVAQRLIREVCSSCKVEDKDPDKVLMRSLGFTEQEIEETTIYKANTGSKCPKCNGNGYKGRRAVCETLYFTREIRNMIAESGDSIDEDEIRTQAIKDGMLTLQDSARELVKMGATTVEEMLRATQSE